MKRREFIAQSAIAGAAFVTSSMPVLLHATDKADSKNRIIGKEDYRYECIHGWGQLPNHLHWQTTHGVCVDKAGLVYIKHQGHGNAPMDTIVVFDSTGRYVRSFGKEFHRGGHGIDVRREWREEFLYLCDIHNRQVVKTNLKGEIVWKLSFPAEAGVYQNLREFSPTNVAFGPAGDFYVGDGYGSHYIHQYDKDAKWVRTWGGQGSEPGKLRTPHGVWLDNRRGRDPSLVVADRANARLQYFTLDGKHLSIVSDVYFPAHFDIRGEVLLVPDLHGRVTLFDLTNKPIAHLGDDAERIRADKKFQIRQDPKQWQPGKFVHPHDASFDKSGNIFVVEWVPTGRVTLLKRVDA